MTGLELSRGYYVTYGVPMIEESFKDAAKEIAFGLVGSGSECFGFDDDVSRDHDFEPGFCLFLPGEDRIDRQTEFQLERAYGKLPRDYQGFRRQYVSPAGGRRHGVIRLADFLRARTGTPDGNLDTAAWFSVPEHYLAEIVNGELYRDDSGVFTKIREALAAPPEDIRKKKIVGSLLLASQSGQYNYSRCLLHGESGAAQMALFEFTKHMTRILFLLNGRYPPYYKWVFRAMRTLPRIAGAADSLTFLLTEGNDSYAADAKQQIVEDLFGSLSALLAEQQLIPAPMRDMERAAFLINDSIADAQIRNLDLLAAAE